MSDPKQCSCVSCPDCGGIGRTWYPVWDYPDEEDEPCDYCNGTGIAVMCDNCEEAMELSDDHN